VFRWLTRRRRRRLLRQPFPAHWEAILERGVAHWRSLDADERERLRSLVKLFVAEKRWEGCGGLELDDEIRVTIAALACLLVLGFDGFLYDNVKSILVYPSTVVAQGSVPGLAPGLAVARPIVPISGQAMLHGPVLLVWDEVRRDAVHPEKGHNVVFHEFAHALDMLDGWVDGVPPLGTRDRRTHWVEVCTRTYRELRERSERGERTFLDPYAGTSEAEFFAVVTEVFFDRPRELRARHPELYDVLMDFYRQDPAERTGAAARARS